MTQDMDQVCSIARPKAFWYVLMLTQPLCSGNLCSHWANCKKNGMRTGTWSESKCKAGTTNSLTAVVLSFSESRFTNSKTTLTLGWQNDKPINLQYSRWIPCYVNLVSMRKRLPVSEQHLWSHLIQPYQKVKAFWQHMQIMHRNCGVDSQGCQVQ